MSEPAISVRNLGKKYRLGATLKHDTLRDHLTHGLRSLLRPFRRRAEDPTHHTKRDLPPVRHPVSSCDDFWALKDVSFDIQPGDIVGVIGRNGAGKSTLLKILSQITEPTVGEAHIRGRVASLLEVGTGFHPELTGRENIFLNGSILGMRRAEIRGKLDAIVDFSGVDRFLDTPVKRYSSGMYVRLAFAVAAHLQPEILLVDEVLAVGDAAFQERCLGKMQDVAASGRTVVFVSHNMGAVRQLTSKCLVFENAGITHVAPPDEAIRYYLSQTAAKTSRPAWSNDTKETADEFTLLAVSVLDADDNLTATVGARDPFAVTVKYFAPINMSPVRINLSFRCETGEVAFVASHTSRAGMSAALARQATCRIPGGLLNCRIYEIGVSADIPNVEVLASTKFLVSIIVTPPGNQGDDQFADRWPGVMCPRLEWREIAMKPLQASGTSPMQS